MKAIIEAYPLVFSPSFAVAVQVIFFTGNTIDDVQTFTVDWSAVTTIDSMRTAIAASIVAYSNANSYGVSASDIIWPGDSPADVSSAITAALAALPVIPSMQVAGVAKANTYAVTAAPAVAGGAGVARFYIDSNGDGTGTAPSAVFASSLQAVVWNSTSSYVPISATVDTNRKYIDVKMGSLSTGLAVLVPILTGAIGNAANGVVVNCLVLVQK